MKVLVHFDPKGEKALGIWWVSISGALENLYVDSGSPEAARGRLIVFNKANPDLSWSEWFDAVAERPPYFEVWSTYDSMGFTPNEMLRSLQPSVSMTA